MKRSCYFIIASLCIQTSSFGQGAAESLLLQGFDQRTLYDVRSLGMGGAVLAAGTNASVLFINPAGLASVEGVEFRASAINIATSQRQTQEWVPNRYWTGLSLMMEDKWGDIKAPVSTDPWEQLQKPFDGIGPNWSRKSDRTLPISTALAIPVTISSVPLVFGIGGSRAIDLNHFFQNNNVTDPFIGQYRPQPLPELQPSDTLRVRWFQFAREREGAIWGITPAVAASFSDLTIGVSATYYTGSSDENERRIDRGFLTFLYNRFRIQDTVRYSSVSSNSSTYKGIGGTVGVKFERPTFAVAATVQIPYTIKREYSSNFQSREEVLIHRDPDSVSTAIVNTNQSGTDDIHFPLSYSLGLLFKPFPRWAVAFDYDIRRLDAVDYTRNDGSVLRPWIAAPSFRMGAEYRANDWLALRGGYREVSQAFSPEGSAIIGDPAVMTVVTAGAGFSFYGVQIEAAYEYARLRYQDSWQSNVNYNSLTQHRVLLEFGYRLFRKPGE